MKSNGIVGQSRQMRTLWLLVLVFLFVGALNPVLMADGSGNGIPPACSDVDTCGTTQYSAPLLPDSGEEASMLDVWLIYDLVLLSLAV